MRRSIWSCVDCVEPRCSSAASSVRSSPVVAEAYCVLIIMVRAGPERLETANQLEEILALDCFPA